MLTHYLRLLRDFNGGMKVYFIWSSIIFTLCYHNLEGENLMGNVFVFVFSPQERYQQCMMTHLPSKSNLKSQ